jgi:hypothetical protein
MDTSARPGRSRAAGLVAAGLVGGVVLAGFATAAAQSSPSPSPSQSQAQADPGDPQRGPKGGGRHGHGHGGMGIHGEFVAPAPNGGYQTIATQRGEVTAVSATSLTVKSEDGFSRTYSVGDDTLVNAGNNGIADVKNGDQVHVTAIVADGKAAAVDVRDATQAGRIRGRLGRPGGRDGTPPGAPPGGERGGEQGGTEPSGAA